MIETMYEYFSLASGVGHSQGWCTPEYLDTMDFIDTMIGELLDSVEGLPVLVLLSTDHGGHDFGHGDPLDSDLNIPIFIQGPGVKVGYEMKESVRNMDLVPTVLWAMGYKSPSPWYGKIMYEAFEWF